MLSPGDPERIGPYQIMDRLGSGGMGVVYLGKSPGGRSVAVKVVRQEYAAQESFRARFAREVTAARRVSGIFTAAVVDAEPDGNPPWLATAYVAGPTLAEIVDREGPLRGSRLWAMGAELAEALQAIHAAGVVHRDLKPTNVLLGQDGLRVIDFGISQVDTAGPLTAVGTRLGTPHYMAPEQVVGEAGTAASDVFAFGSVLTFAATSRPPFGWGSDVMYLITTGRPDLADVPDDLRGLVGRCLAKEPGRRPDVASLLAALGAGPEDEVIEPATVEDPEAPPDGLDARLLDALHVVDAGLTTELIIEVSERA